MLLRNPSCLALGRYWRMREQLGLVSTRVLRDGRFLFEWRLASGWRLPELWNDQVEKATERMTYPIEGWEGFGPLCTSTDHVRQHGAKLRSFGRPRPITFGVLDIPNWNSETREGIPSRLLGYQRRCESDSRSTYIQPLRHTRMTSHP